MTTTINASTSAGLVQTADTSGSLALQTANTTALTINSSQVVNFANAPTVAGSAFTASQWTTTGSNIYYNTGKVGIGTSTPNKTLDVSYSSTSTTAVTAACLQLVNTENNAGYYSGVINFCRIDSTTPMAYIGSIQENTSGNSANNIVFGTRANEATVDERMRINSGGSVGIGVTPDNNFFLTVQSTSDDNKNAVKLNQASTALRTQISFNNPNGQVGTIQTTGSATSYNTSSDYRLKENITPMTGALAKVALLKPVTYKWKVDGSDGEGFIAHELAEVKPDCVSGDKDAVDAEGNPVYQGIDTSFLVATLTAAIQELKAINDTQAETINALTARLVALEGK